MGALPTIGTTTTANGGASKVSSLSFSHSCTLSSPALVLSIGADGSAGLAGASATFGGVSMIGVQSEYNAGSQAYLFVLKAPSAGSQTVAITFGSPVWCVAAATDFGGVDQSAPVEASASATANSASLTTVNANALLVDMVTMAGGSGTGSPGSGQTQYWTDTVSAGSLFSSGSTKPTTSIGSYGTSWANNVNSAICLLALKAAAANSVRSQSDSILNGASRSSSLAKIASYGRSESDSIMNAASRFAIVGKGLAFALSDSVMNGASRLASLSYFSSAYHTLWHLYTVASTAWKAKNRGQ